jgi:uncharacterized protein
VSAIPSPRRDGARLVCSLLWRRHDVPSMEHFRLWEHADGPRLEGTVVGVQARVPTTVTYVVDCAPDWTTRRARVEAIVAGVASRTELLVDDGGRWWRDGRELPELHGCVDVDISVTPATNTLPIRRLGLVAGESRAVDAAWVRVGDAIGVERLPQRYTRLVGGRYRYESGGGAFTALLDVDDAGVVIRYPPAWERVPLVSERDQ